MTQLQKAAVHKNSSALLSTPDSSSRCLVFTLLLPALTTGQPRLASLRSGTTCNNLPPKLSDPTQGTQPGFGILYPLAIFQWPRGPVWCIPTTLVLALSGHKTEKGQYGKHSLRTLLWKKEDLDGQPLQPSQLTDAEVPQPGNQNQGKDAECKLRLWHIALARKMKGH